jgi:hypothetical protein
MMMLIVSADLKAQADSTQGFPLLDREKASFLSTGC